MYNDDWNIVFRVCGLMTLSGGIGYLVGSVILVWA